jgi:dolichyl-phosphate-mannose-protein mannosyltransferase
MTATPSDRPGVRLFWLYLAIITVLAGGMRLYQLGDYSLWEDELFSVRSAASLDKEQLSKRIGQLPTRLSLTLDGADLSKVNWDNVASWRSLGVEPFGARLGPCLIGILSIPLLGWAGRRLLGDRASLIAALLLTVSPWHLFWSQAARFYTLQFLFYNLALIWYLRCCRERSSRLAAMAGLALVLAYLSQPPALVICVVLAADVLGCLIRREPIGLTLPGWVFGVLAVVLSVGLLYYDTQNSAADWGSWSKLQGHSWKIIGASMVIVAISILSVIGLIRSKPRLTTYLAAGAVLPVAALMVLSLSDNFYVHERYCFIVHYAWLALAALGLGAIWEQVSDRHNGALGGAATAVVVVSLLWADMGYYQDGYRRRWAEAFSYVQQQRKPGEDVAVLSSNRTPIARYYLETDDVLAFADFPTSPEKLEALTEPTWLVLPAVSATRGELYPWLNDMAELKRYYDLRVLQPFASIRVYYYSPPNGQDTVTDP